MQADRYHVPYHRRVARRIYRLFIVGIFRLLRFRIVVTGLAHVPPAGAYVIASNHIGHVDPYLLGVVFPHHLCYMANPRPLVPHLLSGMSAGECITETGPLALVEAVRRVTSGWRVLFFPEGKRSTHAVSLSPKSGAAFTALATRTKIVPVKITGTEDALDPGSWRVKPGARITVTIGEPIVFGEEYYRGPARKMAHEAMAMVMRRIASLTPSAHLGSR